MRRANLWCSLCGWYDFAEKAENWWVCAQQAGQKVEVAEMDGNLIIFIFVKRANEWFAGNHHELLWIYKKKGFKKLVVLIMAVLGHRHRRERRNKNNEIVFFQNYFFHKFT